MKWCEVTETPSDGLIERLSMLQSMESPLIAQTVIQSIKDVMKGKSLLKPEPEPMPAPATAAPTPVEEPALAVAVGSNGDLFA